MSTGRFTIRARAARDLSRQVGWLREQAGAETAERFLAAAVASFDRIADAPGLGGSAESKLVELADARRWRIDGFANYLIFYQPRGTGGVTILRVLHAAQDWKRR